MRRRRSGGSSSGWSRGKTERGWLERGFGGMAQVSVTIDGRKYRLACNEGEEQRLESLAGLIDARIGELRASFGEIGDQRLVVMAALTIADNLAEARDAAEAERDRMKTVEAQ